MKKDSKLVKKVFLCGMIFCSLLFIVSCQVDSDVSSAPSPAEIEEDAILFSSSSAHIVTRAGEKRNYFLANTLFRLYALVSKPLLAVTDPAYWQPDNRVEPLYDAISTATPLGQGAINYRDYTPTQSIARFEKRTIDVYGVTFNTQATGEVTNELEPKMMDPLPADQIPRYKLQVDINDRDSLPDLMRGVAKGRRAEDGVYVPLVFKHTVSRLRFEVLKQDAVWQKEDEHGNLVSRDIRLNNITMKDMYSEGVLNLATGAYEIDESIPTIDRVFYNNDTGLDLSNETSVSVPRHMLIFPGVLDANRKIEIDFIFTIDGVEKKGSVFMENVTFNPNYDYLVSFLLLNDDVQLAIFAPEVYEWIDVPINDGEDILGNVITFGGVTWMDRNLGARSADVEKAWDKCRGAYFQYGRSIPYYFDQAKWDALTDAQRAAHAGGKPQLMGDCPNGISDGKGFFYTYNEKGERVYDARVVDRTANQVNLAVTPGEEKNRTASNEPYSFIKCDTGGANGIWLVRTGITGNIAIPGSEDSAVDNFWGEPDKDPCPKGWKIPSSSDYESFLPEKDGGLININWYTIATASLVTRTNEDRMYGRIHGEQGIYLMKNKGTDNAYIIRIRLRRVLDGLGNPIRLNTSSTTAYKQYFEISRYNVTTDANNNKQTTFAGLTQATFQNRYSTTFLSAPVEVMAFPAYGQIGLTQDTQKGLSDDGSSALMKTTTSSAQGRAVLGYLRAETDGFGIKDSSKSPGQQIRCVRDYDAF